MPRIYAPEEPPEGALALPSDDQEFVLPVHRKKALALVRRYYLFGDKYKEIAERYTGTRSYRPARFYWGGTRTLVGELQRSVFSSVYRPYANTAHFVGLDPHWEDYGEQPTLSTSSQVWSLWSGAWVESEKWETQANFAFAIPGSRIYGSPGAGVQDWLMEQLAWWRMFVPASDQIFPDPLTGFSEPQPADPMRKVRWQWLYLCRIIHQMLFIAVRQQEDRLLKLVPGDPRDSERERAIAGMVLEPTGPVAGAIQDAYAAVAGRVQAWRINNGSTGP